MRLIRHSLLLFAIVFLLPIAATASWWALTDRPTSWREASWAASGTLPLPADHPDAAIYVLAARTGGLKGALSVHSWIVAKGEGEAGYTRYDKVGWGMPIRRNAYPADALWYSNRPFVVAAVEGEAAAALLPKLQAAIDGYPFATGGAYRIWPGPNSNSFVAHVLREVPELGARLPANAVGRDYAPGLVSVDWSPEALDLHVTVGGLVGFAVGAVSGIEVHLAGQAAGIDFRHMGLRIPALGDVRLLGPTT